MAKKELSNWEKIVTRARESASSMNPGFSESPDIYRDGGPRTPRGKRRAAGTTEVTKKRRIFGRHREVTKHYDPKTGKKIGKTVRVTKGKGKDSKLVKYKQKGKVKSEAPIETVSPKKETKVTPVEITPKVEKKEAVKKEGSFGDTYKAARKKAITAGVTDHYGDKKGHFTWKKKRYNTETKEEKAARLNK